MCLTEEAEYICIENFNGDVFYIGTLADLRRNDPEMLNAEIKQLYTEKYGALYGAYGTTIVIWKEYTMIKLYLILCIAPTLIALFDELYIGHIPSWQRWYDKIKNGGNPMPESSEAHLRAVQKYKQKVKRITLEFHPTEEELWQHIQSQEK